MEVHIAMASAATLVSRKDTSALSLVFTACRFPAKEFASYGLSRIYLFKSLPIIFDMNDVRLIGLRSHSPCPAFGIKTTHLFLQAWVIWWSEILTVDLAILCHRTGINPIWRWFVWQLDLHKQFPHLPFFLENPQTNLMNNGEIKEEMVLTG